MNVDDEVITCSSSIPEILTYELRSLLTHDFDKPIEVDPKRMEEVACFGDLPTKERVTLAEPDQFGREAKWIAKMLADLPGGSKVFTSLEDLEKVVLQLLTKLLVENLSVVLTYSASIHPHLRRTPAHLGQLRQDAVEP